MKSKVFLLFFTCLIVLLIAEFALRSIGRRPWRVAVLGHSAIHEPHPVLGWRQKSDAELLLAPLHPSGSQVQYSFLAKGLRKTSTKARQIRGMGGQNSFFWVVLSPWDTGSLITRLWGGSFKKGFHRWKC